MSCLTANTVSQPTAALKKSMTAVGLNAGSSPGGIEQLSEFEMPIPELKPLDILVRVVASGLNPVDVKKRAKNVGSQETGTLSAPVVMGYDGAGIVERIGTDCSRFQVGDKVFFAGDLKRQGSNAEFIAIDERIVGRAPQSLSLTAAAAVPLVLLTAWEGLVEGLGLKAHDPKDVGKTLLILPGAGGVGSFVIQLASQVFGLKVIATASRPESAKACTDLGASHVINHREPLKPQLETLGIDGVDLVFNAFDTAVYFDQYCDIIKAKGKIVSIVETKEPLNMGQLMAKSVSFAWEFMFTRSFFGVDEEYQGFILKEGARMIDSGSLKMPAVQTLPFSLDNLRTAHTQQESGTTIGKLVLSREPAAAAAGGC